MKIGVIGAGFIGRAVAQLALAAGHEVMLSNSRGPQSMSSVLSGIWGVKVGSAQDAARFGDVVLVAIPLEHYRSVPAQWLEGKTVMDANNYYPSATGISLNWTVLKPPPAGCSPSICRIPMW